MDKTGFLARLRDAVARTFASVEIALDPNDSYDETRRLLQVALDKRYGTNPDTFLWVRDLSDDAIVYEADDKMWRTSYTIDRTGAEPVAILGEPAEVKSLYVLAAEGDTASTMERFLAKLRDLLKEQAADGDLSADDLDSAIRSARSSIGGTVRAENAKAARARADEEDALADKAAAEKVKTFPYQELDDLPDDVRKALPPPGQATWMAAYNSSAEAHPDDDETNAKIAWAAVKRAGWKKGDGDQWVNEGSESDQARAVAAAEGSTMGKLAVFGEIALVEGGKKASIQIFPPVGTYKHPEWGDLEVTKEFLAAVKANFDAKVYQQELPLSIDLEHQTSLSGAAGWITGLTLRDKGGLWADVELTSRGQELMSDDAYRYFSPAYYEKWQDPASGTEFDNVLIGGALTNRPFFKGMQPVALMSEGRVYAFGEMIPAGGAGEGTDGLTSREAAGHKEVDKMGMTEDEVKEFKELGSTVKTLSEQLAAERTARQAAEKAVDDLRLEARRKELSEFVRTNRLGFKGEVKDAVDRLMVMAEKLGPELFTEYLDERKGQHEAMAESATFKQTSDGRPVTASGAMAEFDAAVAKVMAEKGITKPEATVVVASEQGALYKRADEELKRRGAKVE